MGIENHVNIKEILQIDMAYHSLPETNFAWV